MAYIELYSQIHADACMHIHGNGNLVCKTIRITIYDTAMAVPETAL